MEKNDAKFYNEMFSSNFFVSVLETLKEKKKTRDLK